MLPVKLDVVLLAAVLHCFREVGYTWIPEDYLVPNCFESGLKYGLGSEFDR